MILDDNITFKNEEEGLSQILEYWERKRIAYNVIVGAYGLFVLLPVVLRFGINLLDLVTVFIVGFTANLCYSLGGYVLLVMKNRNIKLAKGYIFWCRLLIFVGTAFSLLVIFMIDLLIEGGGLL
ncbi:hypothetical protein [Lewinella sp. W8]|uniref:hypothetical protein n=1 Tax=Lewinella sp. W8 TaxID=2528208 RepID=UPI001067A605|nr:hypothetical protein [Lewinella sp. W8]MTB53531.1 hypothetical protein [Lewinella sp. W8]